MGARTGEEFLKGLKARKREVWLGDGKPPRKSYTLDELHILLDENKRQAFTDGELLRIDVIKRIFNARVIEVIQTPPAPPDEVQEDLFL